jgi:hypothetical protein
MQSTSHVLMQLRTDLGHVQMLPNGDVEAVKVMSLRDSMVEDQTCLVRTQHKSTRSYGADQAIGECDNYCIPECTQKETGVTDLPIESYRSIVHHEVIVREDERNPVTNCDRNVHSCIVMSFHTK